MTECYHVDKDRSSLEKCPYSELFWSVFSCIPTEYGDVSPRGNSEHWQFLRNGSEKLTIGLALSFYALFTVY